ncbi:sugar ABC transporter substrate-binding protein [Phycicoccus endophyticus]|uniref:Sugar ABC transporter substrate-binding protein n=1 Tax=Phycicoccus endophyticus TaxID=1690220 RepID=A0A7G9R0M2_9MICO|nr:sugar ABC transporter substrate-binding protein [Phycicoccus endophyticus]NHI19428.1 sugar ABC transporter substrate-binding protein [Phycicoccus endophyticus]QNN49147.1 sugar ABC transporter substrate-binding protein [Phycicoccus endophyticus]GGL39057.1 sugar ABC transporter substrate-binding protein [Phycicoccus endophyticus]
MRRTSTTALALLATAALTLSACGRSESDDTEATQGADVSSGKATGTITVWAMGAEGEALPELAKEFEEENPGAKVNVTAIPWDSAHDKFTTAITADSTPDAAMVGTTWMGEFAGLDALDPLPSNIDTSGFFSGAQKTTEVDGTSYGIPWYVETRLLFYRTDLAEKAGYDEAPTDWQGLHDMAKAMQDKAGAKWGIGLQAGGTGSWQSIMPFAWGEGASLTADDAYTFDTPEMLKAVQYYQSFFTDGISNTSAPTQPTTEPDFASGKVPMFISGPWMMSAVEKVGGDGFKDKYSVAKIPEGSAGSSSFVGGSDFVVFKSSKERDTAWKFVQFLAEPETQVKWYEMSTDLPSVQSAWDDPALAGDDKLKVFGEQLETAKAPPSYPTWEQVVANFDTEMEKVTKTGADPKKALESVQQQADSIGTGQ